MFSVYRNQAALTPLREVWEQGDDTLREAIVQASQRINVQLQQDPQSKGESRGKRARILFQTPVGVLYEVDEGKKLVSIVRSWAYRSKIGRHNCEE